MQELVLLQHDKVIPNGSIIRLYEVERFDVIKMSWDKENEKKNKMDFYEYMLVDCSIIKDNTLALINITKNNVNRGSILCEFHKVNVDQSLTALELKKYFGNNTKVFIDLNE